MKTAQNMSSAYEKTEGYLSYTDEALRNVHSKSAVNSPVCFKRVSTFNLIKLECRKFSSLKFSAFNPSLNSVTAVIKSTSGVYPGANRLNLSKLTRYER